MENIKRRMTDEDLKFYSDIYAPKEVAVPHEDAVFGLVLLKDGRIRHYGNSQRAHGAVDSYIESCDGGLSWKEHMMPEKAIGASVYIKSKDKYVKAILFDKEAGDSIKQDSYDGKLCYLEANSPDEAPDRVVEINMDGLSYLFGRQIQTLEKRNRMCFVGQAGPIDDPRSYSPYFFYSDDGGATWNKTKLDQAPIFEVNGRHKGVRWQNYSCEPTFVELSDGTLFLLARTSQDYYYKYYSYDGGKTWAKPEKSHFHAVLTMPNLYKLHDGRILMFWTNTMPLAETDHTEESIAHDMDTVNGVWEDVFTNRDILACAISEDDGKTWKGYREIGRTKIRNSNYFRRHGGLRANDKSCHQSQAFELPCNKVMLSYGQHEIVRQIVIFDIDWLYEESREDDFRTGLEEFSTQLYVKSVLGGSQKGNPGHCAYNRTHGAMMVPDNVIEEAMLIRRIPDELLVSDIQGAVWNYPLLREGKVTVKYKVKGDGIRLGISDFWINPSDPYAYERNIVSFDVNNKTDDYSLAEIKFNWNEETAELYINGELKETKKFDKNSCHGFCYLHIQTLAEKEDREGTLIKFVKAEKI